MPAVVNPKAVHTLLPVSIPETDTSLPRRSPLLAASTARSTPRKPLLQHSHTLTRCRYLPRRRAITTMVDSTTPRTVLRTLPVRLRRLSRPAYNNPCPLLPSRHTEASIHTATAARKATIHHNRLRWSTPTRHPPSLCPHPSTARCCLPSIQVTRRHPRILSIRREVVIASNLEGPAHRLLTARTSTHHTTSHSAMTNSRRRRPRHTTAAKEATLLSNKARSTTIVVIECQASHRAVKGIHRSPQRCRW
jgi:hypothetical protein